MHKRIAFLFILAFAAIRANGAARWSWQESNRPPPS